MSTDTTILHSPQTPAGRRLAELLERLEEQRSTLAALDREQSEALDALRAAEEALARATHERAVDGQKLRDPAKLAAERDAAKAKADEPWSARRQGLQRAERELAAQVARVATEHLEEILSEPDFAEAGVAIRERIAGALGELSAAVADWHATAQRATRLLTFVSGPLHGGHLPNPVQLDQLARTVNQLRMLQLEEVVPAPVPPEMYVEAWRDVQRGPDPEDVKQLKRTATANDALVELEGGLAA